LAFVRIDRNVYVYSTADIRIADFFARPDLDATYKKGNLSVDITINNFTSSAMANQVIDISLIDAEGGKIFNQIQQLNASSGKQTITVTKAVSSPNLWSNETPYLYTLLITLKGHAGKVTEIVSAKVGFRKVELKNSQLLVNGKRVVVRGVNYTNITLLPVITRIKKQ